jgi:hypothetical protein
MPQKSKDSSTKGELGPKIKSKCVVNGHQVNIYVLSLIGLEGQKRLDELKDGYQFKNARCPYFFSVRSSRKNNLCKLLYKKINNTLAIFLFNIWTVYY